MSKDTIFRFVRDDGYVDDELMDAQGNSLERWTINWDDAQNGLCPVCEEILPDNSEVCANCGFDHDKFDGDHKEAIRCALVAMEKQAKELKSDGWPMFSEEV